MSDRVLKALLKKATPRTKKILKKKVTPSRKGFGGKITLAEKIKRAPEGKEDKLIRRLFREGELKKDNS